MSIFSHVAIKRLRLGALPTAMLAFATAAAAQGTAPTPADQMTCQQAREFVARTGRYYAHASRGLVPIYPIRSVEQGPSCGSKQAIWYELHRTIDNPQCLVGYSCSTTN